MMPCHQSINAADYYRVGSRKPVVRWKICDFAVLERRLVARRRRIRREVADIEHGPQQRGIRQDGLRLRDHVRGRVIAAGKMIVKECLDLRHALADCQSGLGRGIGRQLGDIRSNLSRLFTREELCDPSPNGIILVIDVGKRLTALIPHDDTSRGVLRRTVKEGCGEA
jgi:hypothetical protein